MPRVSIGIPVYNGENFLEEAIRSVLAQTYQDLELVIADNASSDRTAEIGQDFAASDGRVRYVRNARNLGAAPNYNRVWEQSRGDLFKWLSHDDRILPGYVAATVAALTGGATRGQGRLRSTERATSNSSSSWWCLPSTCMPTGSPSTRPAGIDTAGLP